MKAHFMRFSNVIYTLICLLLIFQGLDLLFAETANASGLRDHFEGKTVKIIHGSSAGGGYDLLARAFARFLPNYLPGKPARIIVQPLPGGGPYRLNSLRSLINAKPDGLTIGYVYAVWLVAEAIGEGTPQYNLEDVKVIGTPLGLVDNLYCANPKVATTWEDIERLGRPILWGGVGPGIGGHLLGPTWLHELGAPIKLVFGYGGSREMTAAFRRGETELVSSCTTSLYRDYPDWITPENVAPIFWLGEATKKQPMSEEVLKKAGLKTPPHIYEVAKKYITADWQKEAFEVAMNLNSLSKTFFLPKGVPEEVYKAWCEAFRKIVDDPGFLNILDPSYRDEVFPMFAEEAQRLMDSLQGLRPEAKSMLKILVHGR